MLSEEKFFEKYQDYFLYPTDEGTYYTMNELKKEIKDAQTDKDGKMVVLYSSNIEEQFSYIQAAKEKGYKVLLLDSPIVAHLIQKIETSNDKITFTRVDSDAIENLIKKEDENSSKMSDKEKKSLEDILTKIIPKEKYTVKLEALNSSQFPFVITQPEFMRRMKEMQNTGGNSMFGNMPEMFNLIVNVNHSLVKQILNTKTSKKQANLINQTLDLARLSQNLLKGEDLNKFIKRSLNMIK